MLETKKIQGFLHFYLLQNLKEGFTPNIKRMQTLAKPGPLHVSESGVK